jgi:hypothetical protein
LFWTLYNQISSQKIHIWWQTCAREKTTFSKKIQNLYILSFFAYVSVTCINETVKIHHNRRVIVSSVTKIIIIWTGRSSPYNNCYLSFTLIIRMLVPIVASV